MKKKPAKVTKAKVVKIKQAISNGDTQTAIAKQFGISRSLVSDIATGRAHTDVEWPDGGPPVKRAGGQRKRSPEYDPNDERIQELEAEVIHLRDERDHARRAAKTSAKQRGLYRAVADELEKKIKAFPPLPKAKRITTPARDSITEHVVMHLSDGHHDQIITPTESGGLEHHNFPIACRRAETYVDTVIDWTQKTMAPRFKFTNLTILAYGDHTSGEIHGAVQRSYFRNQFKNTFAIGQLHALMYRDLAPFFDQINIVYLPGNHGRRSPKKDFHGAHDNWDYMVGKVAELHCRDLDNVSFLIPDCFSVNIVINEVGFNLSHGDDVRSNGGVPFYGMLRRQKGLVALNSLQKGPRVRYFCMGHHHVQGALADVDGELLLNGAWVGTDSYAYNSFSGYREPSQLLHGVNPKHGVTWRMNVHLRSPGEENGPERYKVEV